jgi:putative salt-induced outer membrane protein YdiY
MNRSRFLVAAAVALTAIVAASADQTAPGKPWKNQTEFSFVSANGNSKSTTISGKETFSYTVKRTSLELTGAGLGSRSQGVVTAEQYNAAEKVDYKFSDRNYVFEKFQWDKDRFAGIRNRYDSSAGLGRELIKKSSDTLVFELGSGWTKEERIASEDKDFSTARAYSKYEHILSPTAVFSQDAEYIQNLDDNDDFRAKTETALTAGLSAHLSIKLSYVWKYVGVPPPGFGRSDTLTTVSLIAVY